MPPFAHWPWLSGRSRDSSWHTLPSSNLSRSEPLLLLLLQVWWLLVLLSWRRWSSSHAAAAATTAAGGSENCWSAGLEELLRFSSEAVFPPTEKTWKIRVSPGLASLYTDPDPAVFVNPDLAAFSMRIRSGKKEKNSIIVIISLQFFCYFSIFNCWIYADPDSRPCVRLTENSRIWFFKISTK